MSGYLFRLVEVADKATEEDAKQSDEGDEKADSEKAEASDSEDVCAAMGPAKGTKDDHSDLAGRRQGG